MHVLGKGLLEVDALGGEMKLVSPGRELVDEAERHQPVTVRSVVGEEARGVSNKDAERHTRMMKFGGNWGYLGQNSCSLEPRGFLG
jgi:hypothetical protein